MNISVSRCLSPTKADAKDAEGEELQVCAGLILSTVDEIFHLLVAGFHSDPLSYFPSGPKLLT